MALSLQHLRSHGAGLTSPTTATPVAAYCYPGSDVPYHDPDWCVCERWVLLADLVYNSADDANLSRVGQGGLLSYQDNIQVVARSTSEARREAPAKRGAKH